MKRVRTRAERLNQRIEPSVRLSRVFAPPLVPASHHSANQTPRTRRPLAVGIIERVDAPGSGVKAPERKDLLEHDPHGYSLSSSSSASLNWPSSPGSFCSWSVSSLPPRCSSSLGQKISVTRGSVKPAWLIPLLMSTAIVTSCPASPVSLAHLRWQPERKRNGVAHNRRIFQSASAIRNSFCSYVRPRGVAPLVRPNERTSAVSRMNVARISRAVASSTAKIGCPDVVLPSRSNLTPDRSTREAPKASRCAVKARGILICHCGNSTPWTRALGS